MLILLQAAEIERLTGYLNDYKCKYSPPHPDIAPSPRNPSTANPTKSK
jgi:hypothetical protein